MEDAERIPSSAEPPTDLSYPSVDEELVGFDDHAENIIIKLRRGIINVDVISIVGRAGIGKTALARKTYNSRSIIDHFDVRAWCSVGQIYNVWTLSLEILKQTGGDRYVNVDYPNKEVRKYLYGRRDLIVLDDIWENKGCDDLLFCFPSRETGSRIMVTTRNAELARYMKRDSDPYFPPFLRDEENNNNNNKLTVFPHKSCPLELRSVGPLVAKKCKGLPFLVIMIAGILFRKKKKKRSIFVA
ncbi:hypothetical protein BC332_27442 [Capsicum chinense]|nr:hypothetical protein BC332_27442 [Capsicum chinense]